MRPVEVNVLRNAKLVSGRAVDIQLSSGLIHGVVGAGSTADSPGVLDLHGGLVLPALVEPHTHLDKALTAHLVGNTSGDLRGAMDAFYEIGQRGELGGADCVVRATEALWMLIERGVTSVRTHVDVGVGTSFDHLDAVIEAASSFRSLVDIQIVALMYAPLAGPEGTENRRRLRLALERGVDLVGAAPQLEPNPAGAIEVLLDAAAEAGAGMDVHLDETLDPRVLHLEHLARRVCERGDATRVTASHCVSLGMQPLRRQQEVARLVADAGISVVALPQSNLYLQGRNVQVATPRGIAPISLLRDHGVAVCAGGDNIRDPFNPLGRGDPLATASSLVVAAHQRPEDAIEMVANAARDVMGLPRAGIEVGAPADLVVLGASDVATALSGGEVSRRTIRRGRLLSKVDCEVTRFDGEEPPT